MASWKDYRFSLDLGSRDDDSIGARFRVVDDRHYYRLTWNATQGVLRLVKRDGDGFRILAEQPGSHPYVKGQMYGVEITAVGSSLSVTVDGEQPLVVNDDSYPRGSIGLYSDDSAGALFDNLSVEAL